MKGLIQTALLQALPLALACCCHDTATAETTDQMRAAMVSRIDQLLAERWAAAAIEPSPLCSDMTFLRRAYLDLTGVVPQVSQVREFLSQPASDKRARLIDVLLQSPAHATHLATTWRNAMLPGGVEAESIDNVIGLQNWLRGQFVENMRYDRVVADLLVATGGGQAGPALFFTALELKPEKLAANTARIFLGLQIECAECHDHPFDRWQQEDFWGYAAFFARLQQPAPERAIMQVRLIDLPRGDVMLPGTDTIIPPKYPGSRLAQEDEGGTRREQLAIWMASRDNPYLARAAVNRVWAHLFGRGLVEPVDDLGPNNPASHPELLDELSAYFVNTGFDLREMFRTLTNTQAYQRSSENAGQQDIGTELFARMAIKPLSAEQLYDSLEMTLAGNPVTAPRSPEAEQLRDPRRLAFLAKMASQSRSGVDYQAGVLQALTLINGLEIAEATDPDRSGLLGALEAPWFSDEQRVEILWLATVSRPPSDAERNRCVQYLSDSPTFGDSRRVLSDILWALLNSAEFALNH
jgi:hypothetical protein